MADPFEKEPSSIPPARRGRPPGVKYIKCDEHGNELPERPKLTPVEAKNPKKATKKIQAEVKMMIKQMLDGLMPDLEGYIRQTAETDPGKAAELLIRLAEFEVPKLGRLDVKVAQLSDTELLLELERRERELLRAKEGAEKALPPHVEPESLDAEFKEIEEEDKE